MKKALTRRIYTARQRMKHVPGPFRRRISEKLHDPPENRRSFITERRDQSAVGGVVIKG